MSKVILLVDDNDAFRESVSDILEIHGYTVIEAEDGAKGLKIVKKEHVDLVITDILMPELEGNELFFEIKKLRPDLKVIGMTGGGRIGTADRVEIMCVAEFEIILHKPFTAEDLIAQVVKALS